MKCDDFLQNLETGGMLLRRLARCHALRCSECAAARDALIKAKQHLMSTEPLTPRQRSLWEQACEDVTVEPSNYCRTKRITFAALACAGIILIIGALAMWPSQDQSAPASENVAEFLQPPPNSPRINELQPGIRPLPAQQTTAHDLDASREFAALDADVALLQSELEQLTQQAELLDGRRHVDEILTKYSNW